jgi:MobA/MobL family
VAHYRLSATTVSRSSGGSSVKSAAYLSGQKLRDEYNEKSWNFSRKPGVLHFEIVVPEKAPPWAADREKLWNAAEARETGHAKQHSAVVGRHFILSLPHQATDEQRIEPVRNWANYLVEKYLAAVDFAIHEPNEQGDQRNHHAHLLMSSRRLDENGFGEKIRELDDRKRGPKEFHEIRDTWEREQNALHDRLGIGRVSAKSLKDRGDDREPTVHMGLAATAMERKGERTDKGDLNREIEAANAEKSRLKAEHSRIGAEIANAESQPSKSNLAQSIADWFNSLRGKSKMHENADEPDPLSGETKTSLEETAERTVDPPEIIAESQQPQKHFWQPIADWFETLTRKPKMHEDMFDMIPDLPDAKTYPGARDPQEPTHFPSVEKPKHTVWEKMSEWVEEKVDRAKDWLKSFSEPDEPTIDREMQQNWQKLFSQGKPAQPEPTNEAEIDKPRTPEPSERNYVQERANQISKDMDRDQHRIHIDRDPERGISHER